MQQRSNQVVEESRSQEMPKQPGNAGVAQLVERNLAKVEVASSSLVSRSKFKGKLSGFPFCLDDATAFGCASKADKLSGAR